MKDYNLERYSDKVWQGGRKFGRAQAINDVLEIIDSWKEFNMGAHKSVLNMISNEVLALKGGEQE